MPASLLLCSWIVLCLLSRGACADNAPQSAVLVDFPDQRWYVSEILPEVSFLLNASCDLPPVPPR
eukprot:2439458-Pyramimonas_sp.AAC.1